MQSGDKIGRYQILGKIGQGGMGEVYLAEDVKLGRRVALKILPSSVADNVERMLRFEHEAKSASALNHPNIITIYEIDDSHEVPFIAMEYVGGETLAKRIRSGSDDIRKTLDIAIQIAGALAAAHDANVIHRDIKPDNVIIRPDGLVKVLDFGLAKLAEKTEQVDIEAQTTAYVLTSPGLVMGTIGYMSPEQARGKHIDARSDIFGFGTMLYQMLSGKLPFAGDNNADILAGILNKDPEPLAATRPDIPPDLEALVRKMLRKDRDERYQSVRELLADLREIRDEIAPGSGSGSTYARLSDPGPAKVTGNANTAPLPTGGQSGASRNTISEFIFEEIKLHPLITAAIFVTVSAVILTAGLSMSGYLGREPARDAFQAMRPAKLTTTGNVLIGNTAVSPEGKLIAYVTSEAGQQSLWVKQTGAPTHLPLVAASNVVYRHVIFSPDSNYVYYVSAEPNGVSALYQVPALGGPVRKLVTDAEAPISFSPSGDRIAFVRDQNTLLTATRDGTDIRTVGKLGGDQSFLLTSWKPDASSIAAAVYVPADSRDHLIEIDMATGAEKPFPSPEWLRIRGLAWLPDASGVVVGGRDPETEYSQIWTISYPDGEAKRITNDLNSYQGLSLTADGRSAVTTQHTFLSNIWVGGPSGSGSTAKITSEVGKDEGMSGVAWTTDGRIVYTTRIKGVQDIWIVNRDGTGNIQLTFNSRSNYSPRVTADGRYIVFVSTREGSPAIWRMGLDGSDQVRVTQGPGSAVNPDVTPDSSWVVYQLQDTDRKNYIWKVSINGGTPIRLTNAESSRPAVSPDGNSFACEYGEPLSSPASRLAVVPLDGGGPQAVYGLPMVLRSRVFQWAPDGKAMIYFDSRDRVDNLWSQPLSGGGPVQLTGFSEDRIFRFDVSRDGQFAIARGVDSADAVMLANFR